MAYFQILSLSLGCGWFQKSTQTMPHFILRIAILCGLSESKNKIKTNNGPKLNQIYVKHKLRHMEVKKKAKANGSKNQWRNQLARKLIIIGIHSASWSVMRSSLKRIKQALCFQFLHDVTRIAVLVHAFQRRFLLDSDWRWFLSISCHS